MVHKKGYPIIFLIIAIFCVFNLKAQEGVRFHAFGEIPRSISDSLYQTLKNAKTTNDRLDAIYTIAEEHVLYGNPDSVIHYAERLDKLSSNVDYLRKVRAKRLLGIGKFMNGLYNRAFEAYVQGLEIPQNKSTLDEVNKVNFGLGEVYYVRNELDKATIQFTKLLAQNIDSPLLSKVNFYSGNIDLRERDYESARTFYSKADSLCDSIINPKLKLQIQLGFGKLDVAENNIDNALGIFENVMQSALNSKFYGLYTEAVLEYGKISTQLGRYEVAEMALAMAYTNAIQWNRLELQKRILNSLRKTYSAKGDFENAYNLTTQYIAVSNQVLKQQNSKALKELEVKYNTLQKENQIFELKEQQIEKQSEIERQKTIKKAVLYGFVILLIPIIALLVVYYQKLQTQSQLNQQQEELNSQRITALLNTQELQLARTSLEAQQEERHRIAKQLHDSIGGNLAGIKLQLGNLKNNRRFQTEIINHVNETYELVRDISHDLVPKKFHQNAFTKLIEDYIGTISENSAVEVTMSAHPKEKINQMPEKLKVELYQVIQELFTNTLKHANANTIEVHINILENTVQLIFEDDGAGFDTNSVKKGIGLQNIESRLEKLDAELIIDSALNRGTAINIEIPIKD
ncbi:histidine kinase [Flagellimonas sp. 389]|uniref:tetratricopeptide repeat-containing sensor histidine kinase n=1 Tax=Flagellimonas sp. 389 TaxID=2835862 RepID=UPI001BD2C990|nr:ATP-binding protein [Flagellimonas sp. 389]MBS9462637.1 histidine kinase [Flagellimonas sp. 389]